MNDLRDPAIKLFGRTIPLPEAAPGPPPGQDPISEDEEICRGITTKEAKEPKPDIMKKNQYDLVVSSILKNSHEDVNKSTLKDDKPEQDQSENDPSGQERVLKKPDKILPCPRCNSMDTKFCYYNNYNVSQPRHFCKNCQRYWTAGGTMRNVPVGAGRRKSKHSGIQQSQLCVLSDPFKALNGNDAVRNSALKEQQCSSVPSVLNAGEQSNIEEPSCEASATPIKCLKNNVTEKEVIKEQNGFRGCYSPMTQMHPMQYFQGPSWPYWGQGWNDIAAMAATHRSSENSVPNPGPLIPPPTLAPPAFCPLAVPFPYMPASYYACMPSWPNGAWSVPWLQTNTNKEISANNLPALGKHSRDATLHKEEETSEKCLWVPKTLRIDDPDEAAKSSIWSTLGIKPDNSVKRSSLFKAFQSEDSNEDRTSVQILHANPAALSRSHTFQEAT